MNVVTPRWVSTESESQAISISGQQLLDDPLLNRSTAFPEHERRELGLMGLLPLHTSTIEEQLERVYENYRRKDSDIERYIFLTALQDRNETLFYRLLQAQIHSQTSLRTRNMIPFTVDQFLNVFERYNVAVWPAPLFL